MAKITLIHGDAEQFSGDFRFILTDPPFDMRGAKLAKIFEKCGDRHVVLISTFRQIAELLAAREYEIGFDFVFDTVAPKISRNFRQPNYTHANGVYLRRPGEKSIFDRRRCVRSDAFGAKGYWPTVFRAAKERSSEHGQAKNESAIRDLLGSFDIDSVLDPFAGSGTTAIAAHDLDIDCCLIEKNEKNVQTIENNFRFLGKQIQKTKL